MRNRFFAVWTVVIVATAGMARAEQSEEDMTGPYGGFAVSFAFDNFDVPSSVSIDPAYGFSIWGGYRFLRWVGADAQFDWVTGYNFDDVDNTSSESVLITANAKAYPLANRMTKLEPFVLVGIGLQHFQTESDSRTLDLVGFVARFGGGLDYHVTDHIALQVSTAYILPTGSVDGRDSISLLVGTQFRF